MGVSECVGKKCVGVSSTCLQLKGLACVYERAAAAAATQQRALSIPCTASRPSPQIYREAKHRIAISSVPPYESRTRAISIIIAASGIIILFIVLQQTEICCYPHQ